MIDGLVPVEAKVLSVTLVLDNPMLLNELEVECGLVVTSRVVPRLEFAIGLEGLNGTFVKVVGFFVVVRGRFVTTVVMMVDEGLLVLLTGFLIVA